jgi:integrin alpha FG-GAP repeat containing protein 1
MYVVALHTSSHLIPNQMLQTIPLTSLVPLAVGVLLVDTTFSASKLPVPLRVGDIDLDGFPDLVLIRADSPTPRTTQFTPTILMNLPCGTAGSVGCEKGGRRAWRMVQTGTGPLNEIKDARGVAFMDIDEDGSLDVLVQRTGKDGKGTLTFVQNNFYHDAFFLKAIGKTAWSLSDRDDQLPLTVLNSPCPGGWCTAPNGSTYHVCIRCSFGMSEF